MRAGFGNLDSGSSAKNRRIAIRHAIAQARRGDIALIAGKGHETYQETKGVRRPFSDVEASRAELSRWRG